MLFFSLPVARRKMSKNVLGMKLKIYNKYNKGKPHTAASWKIHHFYVPEDEKEFRRRKMWHQNKFTRHVIALAQNKYFLLFAPQPPFRVPEKKARCFQMNFKQTSHSSRFAPALPGHASRFLYYVCFAINNGPWKWLIGTRAAIGEPKLPANSARKQPHFSRSHARLL